MSQNQEKAMLRVHEFQLSVLEVLASMARTNAFLSTKAERLEVRLERSKIVHNFTALAQGWETLL